MGAAIQNLLWWTLVSLLAYAAKGLTGSWWAYAAVVVPALVWYLAVQFGGERRS